MTLRAAPSILNVNMPGNNYIRMALRESANVRLSSRVGCANFYKNINTICENVSVLFCDRPVR